MVTHKGHLSSCACAATRPPSLNLFITFSFFDFFGLSVGLNNLKFCELSQSLRDGFGLKFHISNG